MLQNKLKFRQKLMRLKNSCKRLRGCRLRDQATLSISLLLLAGCASFQTQYSEHQQGQWETRALIKDKQRDKSYIAVIDIYAKKNDSLRMDLISPLGDHMGSFLMVGQKVQVLDVQNRTYYHGAASSRSLSPLINLPLNPKDLYFILFEQPKNTGGWSCELTENTLEACENKRAGLFVSWSNRVGAKRTIEIEHSSAEIQINFKKFSPKVKRKKAFIINVPSSFKKIKL